MHLAVLEFAKEKYESIRIDHEKEFKLVDDQTELVVVKIDHMRNSSNYVKTLENWTEEFSSRKVHPELTPSAPLPVFFDLNFLRRSVVVMGRRFRYLRTASSEIVSLPAGWLCITMYIVQCTTVV